MADEVSNNDIRVPGDQSLPAPGVQVTRTRVWLRLRHPETATPEGAVIMNNLAVLSDQLGTLMTMMTATSPGGRKRKRTSSVGSAASSITSAGAGDNEDEDNDANVTAEPNEIATALANLGGDNGMFTDTLYDQYLAWTKDTGTHRYLTASKYAIAAAQKFWAHCITFFSEDVDVEAVAQEGENPIVDNLNLLSNIDAKVQLFVDFGKRHKESNKAASNRKSPRPQRTTTSGGESQSTGTGNSQERRSAKRRNKKTKNVSFESEVEVQDSQSLDEDEDLDEE